MNKKVLIGMSGGVDSSAAAYLLKEQGYEVIGVNFRLWDKCIKGDSDILSADAADVKTVCDKIGIRYMVLDFKKEFEENVIDYFVDEYINGRTPNPCCMCNRRVKFEKLLEKADELGIDYIGTGHYARIIKLQETGRYTVAFAENSEKDQSYALYGLSQAQLRRTLMPIGDYSKPQVREIAEKAGLITANKKDSQEICFIEDDDYAGFIRRKTGRSFPKGKFVLKDGTVVGNHEGIIKYTIGQRKGLGIALGKPAFVIGMDMKKNHVILGADEDTFCYHLTAKDLNFMSIPSLEEEMEVQAKIRYKHEPADCTIKMLSNGFLKCTFKKHQRAITPGQIIVLYKDNYILGGGTIIKGF